MTRIAMFSTALLLGAPAAAQVDLQPLPGIEAPAAADQSADAREKIAECAGEKFVFAWGVGARPTKVTLCSEANATTDEVVRMLDDAATKIEASAIPEDRRVAIVQQIRGKIAELEGKAAAAVKAAPEPKPVPAPAASSAARERVPEPARAAPAPLRAAQVPLPNPRLAFECYTPGEIGSGGPCTTLARETRLTVKARDPLPAGIKVRFVRNGESRGELALGAMGKGQAARLTLPRGLCAGVVEAETRIEVIGGGQVLDSAGPYLLRC